VHYTKQISNLTRKQIYESIKVDVSMMYLQLYVVPTEN